MLTLTHHAWHISIARNVAHICVFRVGEDLLGKRLEGGDVGVLLGVNHGHLDHHHSHGDQEDAQEPDHHGNIILRKTSLDTGTKTSFLQVTIAICKRIRICKGDDFIPYC